MQPDDQRHEKRKKNDKNYEIPVTERHNSDNGNVG